MQKRKKVMVLILTGGAVLCACLVIFMIYHFYKMEMESEEKMAALKARAEELAEPIKAESQPIETEVSQQEEKVPNPYADLFEENEDMAAWLSIEGTIIDYPVMQRATDEEYYLERDFYGNPDKAGCLILDHDSSPVEPVSTNLIIHGHNMKAGTMFGGLQKYESEEYAGKHKYITLCTREKEHNYEVIAAFYSQVYYETDLVFKYYNFFEADTKEEFLYFYDNIKKLALYDTGVEAEFGDSFLTLSTCSYQVEDGRFVVVAKEIEEGPSYYDSSKE